MRSILLTILLLCGTAIAGETTLTWSLPTDSEACVADPTVPDIASTQIWELVSITGPAVTTVTLTGLSPGEYTFTSAVTDTAGIVSRFGNVTTKTISAAPLTVVDPVVYMLSQTMDVVVLGPVGTVPLGTPCDSSMQFNGKYVVPWAAVSWVGTARPVAVFAACAE